ncbi:MAG: PAS domain S-box protein, partial [Chloroflexi bacterium]|nr:PAS domain S-box protein [Chloroflexota bacterium]
MEHEQVPDNVTYSNEFLRAILDSVTDSISIIDVKDYGIVGTNRAFLKQYGLTGKEAIGRKCYELTHHRRTPCVAPFDICPLE